MHTRFCLNVAGTGSILKIQFPKLVSALSNSSFNYFPKLHEKFWNMLSIILRQKMKSKKIQENGIIET